MARANKTKPVEDDTNSIKAAPQDRFRRSMVEYMDQLKEYNRVPPPGAPYKASMSPTDFLINMYYCFLDQVPYHDFSKIGQSLIDFMADKIEDLSIDNQAKACYTNTVKVRKVPHNAYRPAFLPLIEPAAQNVQPLGQINQGNIQQAQGLAVDDEDAQARQPF